MKATDYKDDNVIFALCKGDAGAGKSIGVSSFVKKGPMFFFEFVGKIKAIFNFCIYKNK
jgi:hypothetical protein